MPNKNTQTELFAAISNLLPANISLAGELADLLGVSTDSAYRRMRGETSMSVDELFAVSRHFGLSLDSFSPGTADIVSFRYFPRIRDIDGFADYLGSIAGAVSRAQMAPARRLVYAAVDVPVFHLFDLPALAEFKLFYWMNSVLDLPVFSGKKFSLGIIPPDLLTTGQKLMTDYNRLYVHEVWSETTITNLCKQINFYHESGYFDNTQEAFTVIEQTFGLLEKIKRFAGQSSKLSPGGVSGPDYQLYWSETEIGNNTILVNYPQGSQAYLTYGTLNVMTTTNEAFCAEIEHWTATLIKKSVPISGVSEKFRNRFFQAMTDQLNTLRKRLETA